ncbi:MAG: hypothetical protein AB8C13_04735 [Phycisphaerales bacterium]
MTNFRRRLVIVLGCCQLLLALLFGFQSSYLASSASYKLIFERENKLIDSMKNSGSNFSDEEHVRSLISKELLEIPYTASKAMRFTSLVLGASGLFLVLIGFWPNRKVVPETVLDTGE